MGGSGWPDEKLHLRDEPILLLNTGESAVWKGGKGNGRGRARHEGSVDRPDCQNLINLKSRHGIIGTH